MLRKLPLLSLLVAVALALAGGLAPPAQADDALADDVTDIALEAFNEVADTVDAALAVWDHVVERYRAAKRAAAPSSASSSTPSPSTPAASAPAPAVRAPDRSALPPGATLADLEASSATANPPLESGLCPCCKVRPAIECCQTHGRCMYTPPPDASP